MRGLIRYAFGLVLCFAVLAGASYWQHHHHSHPAASPIQAAVSVPLTL